MAGRTNTEKIDELLDLVGPLTARIDNLRRDLDQLLATRSETRIAVLEEKTAKLEKAGEESARKQWMLTMAVIGALLTLMVNIIVFLIRR